MTCRVLNYNEAADRAGVVRRTLERMIACGEGPPVVAVSTRRRGIIESDLDAWLMGRRLRHSAIEAQPKRGRPRKVA
jgi:predicted DNA-binding transcriptional regulator AlpA